MSINALKLSQYSNYRILYGSNMFFDYFMFNLGLCVRETERDGDKESDREFVCLYLCLGSLGMTLERIL